MKYSLKNEYKELLNEEIVSIIRSPSYEDEVYDVQFNDDGGIVGVKFDPANTNNDIDISQELLDICYTIIKKYSTMSKSELLNIMSTIGVDKFRKDFNNIEDAVNHLNEYFLPYAKGQNKKANRIGIGELAVHLGLNTTNYNTDKEPDARIGSGQQEIKLSVKSVKDEGGLSRGAVRTGEASEVQDKINEYIDKISFALGYRSKPGKITKNTFKNKIKEIQEKDIDTNEKLGLLQDIQFNIENIKKEILKENDANSIAMWTGYQFIVLNKTGEISIQSYEQGRISFNHIGASRALRKGNVSDTIKQQTGSTRLSQMDIINSIDDKYSNWNLDDETKSEISNLFINGNNKAKEVYFEEQKQNNSSLYKLLLKNNFVKEGDNKQNRVKSYNLFLNTLHPDYDLESNLQRKSISTVAIDQGIDWTEFVSLAIANIQNQHEKNRNINLQTMTLDQRTKPFLTRNAMQNSSYIPQGKVLKEVYSYLFKKKLVSEGGLAGHMMHPYEALDMTPKQIIDRIKEYGVPQSIIEKVDGQNLFFTVEEDGTLMFARNKEDMTHNDLVEKFTNHPAEVPFVTGGNAIKRGIDQWLSSAGSFGQQEILDIFHPDGEARSFINFEIMHKDHPNQIEYGENYIVFHSIVDFVDGREAVYSSNNSQRLDKLINLMRQGVESGGYILASNRTVDLNSLSNVQIEDYIIRIKEITESLGITEDQFLADGVLNVITEEMKNSGINLSEEAYRLLSDFVLYGEDSQGNKIKSKDFTSLMDSADVKVLRAAGLTSVNKALSKVLSILSPFKEVFVDLGIDLLKNVKSAYASSDSDQQNISILREKLNVAIEDLQEYYLNIPESNWTSTARRLVPHLEKILEKGVDNIVSTSVEGGVYDHEGDLLKVTGGFAPMNQILGAAYRDREGIFTTFKQKFMQQESNRRSLKTIFSSIY